MSSKSDKSCKVKGYKLNGLDEDQVIAIVNEDYGPVVVYYNEFTTRSGDLVKSVQVRKFYKPDKADYFTFTQKGATIPLTDVPDLIEALMGWAMEHQVFDLDPAEG